MSGLASVLHEKELATLKKMLIFCKSRGWERDDMLNFWELHVFEETTNLQHGD